MTHILPYKLHNLYIVMVLFSDISKFHQNFSKYDCVPLIKQIWNDIKIKSWESFHFWGNFPFKLHPNFPRMHSHCRRQKVTVCSDVTWPFVGLLFSWRKKHVCDCLCEPDLICWPVQGCGARVHLRPDATLAVSLNPRTNQTYLHVLSSQTNMAVNHCLFSSGWRCDQQQHKHL